ncbi:MAG: thermonuclease family protein [Thermomicrobiales bacterium]
MSAKSAIVVPGVFMTIALIGALVTRFVGFQVPVVHAQSSDGCGAFDSRIWAQSVLDEEPWRDATLDPDRDGLACESLPLGAAPALWTDQIPPSADPVDLVSVTDGDTIDVIRDGQLEAVRMVGVDAAESGGPYQDRECFGIESGNFLQWLTGQGGQIYLEQDREDRDRYGRLLRWVWLERDGTVYLLNEAVIRAGYAERYRDTPNRRYVDELTDAEAFAQGYGAGLWSACEGETPRLGLDQVPAASAPTTTPPPVSPMSGCDPAYPDVCIPPPPPDLSCRDIPYTKFRVLPPDPHHFDGNQDGVACEGPG